jgi:outer membrane receptor protein involved in Fe transport
VDTLSRGGLFSWRTTTNLRYAATSWDVGLNWRHLPAIKSANYVTDPTTTVKGAHPYDIFGLTANVNVSKKLAVGAGIDNLFNRDPNRVGAGQVFTIPVENGGGTTVTNGAGSTNSGYYDVLGRRYFVNLKLRF